MRIRSNFTADQEQFHLLLYRDQILIATGGVHSHLRLLDENPRLKQYPHWLALVYTVPQFRKQGYGTLLCQHIEVESQKRGINQLHLFTDTAESLYRHLGWREVERLTWHNREIVVMEKTLGEAP